MIYQVINVIKKILVAHDGSEPAAKALNFALELAEKCSAEVQIISVVPTIDMLMPRFTPESPPENFYKPLIDKMSDRFKEVLSEALKSAERTKPTVKISTRLLEGRPAYKIVQTAEEDGFDLIVMGSRGLSGVGELVLGSVSDKVADTARCPVLIVK